MTKSWLSGRWVTLLGTGLVALLAGSLVGCTSAKKSDDLTVGFIYIGPKKDYVHLHVDHLDPVAATLERVR